MNAQDDLLAQDCRCRQEALTLDSFIVEAPAGAGKTELLVQRVLKLLSVVNEPEAVVALTFTNKAAAEMRERLEGSLQRARRGEWPTEAHKQQTFELAQVVLQRSAERGWNLEQQGGRLRLLTLDALCASLARQMPLLSRFGTQPAVADDPWPHYREAARRAVALIDSEDTLADSVACVLDHFDNRAGKLVELLAGMLARREQWQGLAQLDHPEAVINAALLELLQAELAQVATQLDARWQARLMPLARFAASQRSDEALLNLLDWTETLGNEVDELPDWRALAKLLLTEKGSLRQKIDKRVGFPAEPAFKAQKVAMQEFLAAVTPAQVAALQRALELPVPESAQDGIVRALGTLLKLAAAQLWLIFGEHGEVDFVELAGRAIDALGDELDPSELGLRLDYRIEHLLVDEFQDTSPTQIKLLKRLTAGWTPDDGRTLFVVGDPMQSIYRFRKADVALFLNVAQTGINEIRLRPLRLSRNNRSAPALVEWINQEFPRVFPAADEPRRGEIRYREFVATREAGADAGVSCHLLCVEQQSNTAQRAEQEAAHVLRVIEAEWAIDSEREITVLARSRGHLAEIAAGLRRRNAALGDAWRFAAVELEALLGQQIVQDLLALTRALHHRGDRLNWLAVLRAPWCGLRLEDLLALAGDDQRSTIWALMNDPLRCARLSEDGQRRLAHVRGAMAEALAAEGRWLAAEWVERCWRRLGGDVCAASEQELADAQAYFERLQRVSATALELDRLEGDMRQLYAVPLVAASAAAAAPKLQLMTIHKAKGLEFDTVIVPGLHREMARDEAPLLAWEAVTLDGDTQERLIVAPIPGRAGVASNDCAPSLYDYLRRLERVRGMNEAARVLYVAATRAKRRLHWVGVAERDSITNELREPSANTPLGSLWPAFCREATRIDLTAETSVTQSPPLAQFVPKLFRRKSVPVTVAVDLPVAEIVQLTPEVAEVPETRFAAAVGTLVHACLEQIAADPAAWDLARVTSTQGNFARWLELRGWPASEAADGAQRTAAMLQTTLASDAGRWILGARRDAAAELALAKVGAGGTAQVRVVDRCFIADGTRWIIDYKTASFGDEPALSVLTRHAERYRVQLTSYAELFATEDLPVCCAVFYVAYGKLVVLD